MFQTILVPLDGSAVAEAALPMARSIAHHAGATLRLVRVLPDLADQYFWAPLPGTSTESNLRQHYVKEAENYLETIAHRLRGEGVASVVCDVVAEEDDISHSIRLDALRHGADLIVMINHGRGVLGRFWRGSIANELVRSLPVPVLLVPTKPAHDDGGQTANLRQVLVALDGTPEAEQMLEPALAISRAMGAELTLVHVAPSAAPQRSGPEAQDYLETVARRLRDAGATIHTRHLVGGAVASALLKEAGSDADLLAVEPQERHGLERLLHHSITDQVVHETTHPVLVLRRSVGSAQPLRS